MVRFVILTSCLTPTWHRFSLKFFREGAWWENWQGFAQALHQKDSGGIDASLRSMLEFLSLIMHEYTYNTSNQRLVISTIFWLRINGRFAAHHTPPFNTLFLDLYFILMIPA
jgi:hypothetical protein